ncbi:MAG: hypothetical protein Tsb0018_12910 [Opitutales bacterium]
MDRGNNTHNNDHCTYMGRERSLTLVLPLPAQIQCENDKNEKQERSQSARTKRRKKSPPKREKSAIISPRNTNTNDTVPVPILELNGPSVNAYNSPPLQTRHNDKEKQEEDIDETEDEFSTTPSSEKRKHRSSLGKLTPRSLKGILKKHSSKKKEIEKKKVHFKDEPADTDEQLENEIEISPIILAEILRVEIIPQIESDEPEVRIRIALQHLMEALTNYIDDDDIETSQLEDPRTLLQDIEACYQALVAILEWKIENSYLERSAQQRLRFIKLFYPLLKDHLGDDPFIGAITGMHIESWIEALKTIIQTKSNVLKSQERARQITLGLHLETYLKLNGTNTRQAFLCTLDMLSALLTISLLENYEGQNAPEALRQCAFHYMLITARHAEHNRKILATIFFNRIAIALFKTAYALNNALPPITHDIEDCKTQANPSLEQLFAIQ